MSPTGSRVVVIGSGGAGYCAALAAREAGADVHLFSKAPLGMANCTAYAGGGFTAPVDGLTPAEHMAMTREVGRGLSEPSMHRAVSEGAEAAFARLTEWGVRYTTRRGGLSVRPGSKGGLLGGTGLTLPLRDRAAATGVHTRAAVAVTAILRAGEDGSGRAVGVELFDPADGSIRREPADAVIVATGGGGAIYPRSDNPVRTTGDGYRLLYAAGVPVFDMEFVQWYPLGYAEEGFPCWMIGLPIIDDVPLENSDGERFYDSLLAQWGLRGGVQANLWARDKSAVAFAREWKAGREVLLRYDLADRERLVQIDPLAAGRFRSQGGTRPVRVAPLVHYFCGGAVAAPDGVTAVPGLYACGEVVGGFDGANRMGGNALTAVTVLSQLTGSRAANDALSGVKEGLNAGELAPRAKACGSIAGLAEAWTSNLAERAVAAPTAAGLRERIQAVTGEGLGLVRTAEGLSECLTELRSLRAVLPDLTPAGAAGRLVAAECASILATAELVGLAALLRDESRGGHFRDDFPAENACWAKHIVISPERVADDAGEPLTYELRIAGVGDVSPAAGE